MIRSCPYNWEMEYLCRDKFSIKSYGYGFEISKPIPRKLGLRVIEGAFFDIDLGSLIKSGAC
jgi:hypothetical protein